MRTYQRRATLLFVLAIFTLLSLGCFPGGGANSPAKPAGFFMGVWHGWIAPISLIAGFFNENIRVYEMSNRGWGYDFGFYMAIIAGFGGLSLFRKRSKENPSE